MSKAWLYGYNVLVVIALIALRVHMYYIDQSQETTAKILARLSEEVTTQNENMMTVAKLQRQQIDVFDRVFDVVIRQGAK